MTTTIRLTWQFVLAVLLVFSIAEAQEIPTAETSDIDDCPPFAFVKRNHFKRPFGIGTIIGWNIYTPNCGIYTYDPKNPDREPVEIFQRDDGTIYDMSVSYDAKKLLFAFRSCQEDTTGQPASQSATLLKASRVYQNDTLNMVLLPSTPGSSGQKPNHSFWDRQGTEEWMSVAFASPRKVSKVSVYWFDDQPRGGCAIPESWHLEYSKDSKWIPVEKASEYGTTKNSYNHLSFDEVETTGLRIVVKCRPGKSGGIQRWRVGSENDHAEMLADNVKGIKKADPGEKSFHIYEINVDGTGLRKITEGPYHDIHPFYLPNGKIGFVSTRVEAYTLCQPGAACALHVMDPDGSNIKRIHFGTLADHSPFVMDDGTILFSRWEYQDKSLTYPQGLWSINPDGTQLQLFYGNTIYDPAVTWQAKQIPGRSEVVSTLAPHHGHPVGAIGIIDRRKGMENPKAITNITPEIPYQPHLDRRGPGDRQFPWSYRDPYPIAKDRFLVAYGGPLKGGPGRYRIYVLHENGQKQLVYEDESISCFNPLPLTTRPTPHRKPGLPESDSKYGTFIVTDIYQGMTGVKRGEVKDIRVMRVEPKKCNMRGKRAYDMDPLIGRGTYYVKHCLGTVPVDEKGTAVFKAPAGVELYFQALDSKGMELQRMGTVTQIMPGEKQSCIGCHETEFSAPQNRKETMHLLSKTPVDITPPPWGAGPVDFVKHVQPVFDKYCVGCHGGVDPKKGLDLSDGKTRYFNMAYENLTERRLVHFAWLKGASAKNWKPLSTGSRVSKLIAQMEKEPCNVEMDDESRRRIYTWIEANVPYYGTYEHTRPGRSGSRDAFENESWANDFNQAFRSSCAACHGGHRVTWINLTRPEWSRALMAPLARSAGGLELCKPKNKKQPPNFQNKNDPAYQAMLKALEQGRSALYAKPRMDMPGGQPEPYPTDFGKLFDSFSGP